MILQVCNECKYGAVKNATSHCAREAVYSHLTNCIQKKALVYYLEAMKVVDGELLKATG